MRELRTFVAIDGTKFKTEVFSETDLALPASWYIDMVPSQSVDSVDGKTITQQREFLLKSDGIYHETSTPSQFSSPQRRL